MLVAEHGVSVVFLADGSRSDWPVRGTLEAADGNLAVLVRGRKLYLLHLRDGRSSFLSVPRDDHSLRRGHYLDQPIHADLTTSGLFYSYNVGDRRNPGRVVFVPRASHDRTASGYY